MTQTVRPDTPVRFLKGVGPERSKVLARLGLETLDDLLSLYPRRYEDRRSVRRVSELAEGEKVCVRGIVSSRSLFRVRSGQSVFRLVIMDGSAPLVATWFHQPYLSKVFLPKTEVVLYGDPIKKGKRWEMLHPEYEIVPAAGAAPSVHSGRLVPVYPLTEDLSQKGLRQLLFRALGEPGAFSRDPLSPRLLKGRRLMPLDEALREIHFPKDLEALEAARRRLVFDEFFRMQLVVQQKRAQFRKENKDLRHETGESEVKKLLEALGFPLTAGQSRAIDDILSDMKKDRPMHRLVQGDVGSGKTAVAAAALMYTAANGFQGTLMAPTEVLAQQHFFNLSRALSPLGVRLAYLGQGMNASEKEAVRVQAAAGEIEILVGTHALVQSGVRFKKLGLAVVDEQHKFGVFQRSLLKDKLAGGAHFLLLTATPIPRTLALTLYGDLDLSLIAELPKGRQPVRTLWVGSEKRADVCGFLDAELSKGRQAYVVCPLVSETAGLSVKSALAAHRELSAALRHRKIGLLHGRMKSAEKKRVMEEFKERRLDCLVSTVVIEVGVDVPNATLMVIENAERFGLAQLHQLRGRVGRGEEGSTCILFSDTEDADAVERLLAFENTSSGFEIAEIDLALRGAGNIAGARQHGAAELKIGDIVKDAKILEAARDAAKAIVDADPALNSPENRPLRSWIRTAVPAQEQKKAALVG